MKRVPLLKPFTPTERIVVECIGMGMNYNAIASHLGIAYTTVKGHTEYAAKKIPGDLAAQTRVLVWARGGTMKVLTGESLRRSLAAKAATLGERR